MDRTDELKNAVEVALSQSIETLNIISIMLLHLLELKGTVSKAEILKVARHLRETHSSFTNPANVTGIQTFNNFIQLLGWAVDDSPPSGPPQPALKLIIGGKA